MRGRFVMRIHGYLSGLLFLVLIMSVQPAEGHYESEGDLIEIMFIKDAAVRLRDGNPLDLSGMGSMDGVQEILQLTDSFVWERITSVSEEELDAMETNGEDRTGEDLYNLNNIYRLRFEGDIDIWELSNMLEELPGIILARPVPLPQPNPTPPNYQGFQGYLKAASFTPTGIDAIYAWTQVGGNGAGVTVCDLEYSWNYNHADITKASGSQINSNVHDPFPNDSTHHGTAVIGVLVSDYNGWGTTGICYGATLKTCGTYYGVSPNWNVPGAMAVAISNLSAGDVILLEQQWEYVPGSDDYIPIEWWLCYSPNPQTINGVYTAIQTAIANGIHVVEAGGNAVNGGGVDMDAMTWLGDCGSMIVGAGGVYPGGTWPGGDRQRLSYSNYGSRFTCQGWGEDVVTTGYGTLYNAEGFDYFYTSGFSGTSSASPIVAGAAADCVGFWVANGNPASTLTPSMMRNTLVITGSPQLYPPIGDIGPLPNLMGAFAYLETVGIEGSSESSLQYSMNVSPNPSSGNVTFNIIGVSDIHVERIVIYDISGRVIIDLDNSSLQEGNQNTLQWNCCDMNGSRINSGMYMVRAEWEYGSVTVPFIILEK